MKTIYVIIILLFLLIVGSFIKYKTNNVDIPADKIYDLDKTNLALLSTMNDNYNYLFEGNDYNLKLNDKWAGFFAQNIFIINKNTICLVISDKIYYYIPFQKKIIRKLEVNKYSIANKVNNSGDLIVFSGGNLYKYYYQEDKLVKLKEMVKELSPSNHTIYYPSPYIHPNKISYSEKRNSIFYSAFNNPETRERGIYELSLNDYSLKLRGKGFSPQVNDEKGVIYYINNKQKNIIESTFDGFKEEILLTYTEDIRDIVVIDEETIFFAHAAAQANIKGVKFSRYKVYDHGVIKYIKTNGSILRPPFDVMKVK